MKPGLIERTVYPIVPPRVDYALTELGCTLHDTIKALVVSTETNQAKIIAARRSYDERAGEKLW